MVGDLNGNKDFSVIKPFAFWTQHVLPLVYGDEISYMETLDKVVKLLNELIKNNNKLPEYIQQIVEEYITGGPLEEVLRGILADFILNVKYPPAGITPAKGDGTANDYEAIQGCIDYAASKGGGVVYFPFGKYLTSKLTLKPNVSLMGFGKYCTSIVLTGGETDALLSGTVTDCGIYNITLDANMSIQVNDVDVLTLTGSNIQLMNVILTDGYYLFNIEKTGDNIELNNVEFRYAVESMLRIGGTVGTLNANNIKFGNLSTIKGVAAIISDSNNDVITGIVSNDILPLFAQLDGNNNVLKGVVASTNVIAGDGQNNVYDFYGKTKSETYTGNVYETVHGSKSTHIDVMSTWAVDGNSTESVDGTKSEIVTGVSSAQYNGDRTVNGKNFTETMSGKKVINAQDIVLNPTNPLTYKTPEKYNEQYSYVPAKDVNNNEYNILVAGEDFNPDKDRSIILNGTPTKEQFNVVTEYEDNATISGGIGEDYYKTQTEEKPYTLTVGTYNILSCNYWRWPPAPPTDTDTGLANGVATMIKSGAKIITLNEVCDSPKYTPLEKLKTIRFNDIYYQGDYSVGLQGTSLGDAIASSSGYPLLDKNVTIMPDGSVNRFLLNAKVNVNGKTLSIYCSHLSLDDSRRLEEVQLIIDKMKADTSVYKLLMGDLNFTPNTTEFSMIVNAGYQSVNNNLNTFPSDDPSDIIDYIFKTPNITANDYGVIADVLGSDHCLLWANITLN